MIELVRTLNIPVVDIHEKVFSDAYIEPLDMYPFGLPGHFNAAGYAEVAKEIVESVGGAGNYSQ